MKYENLKQILNNFLGKEEHWLAHDEYSRMRSYSWRTVNFYHHVELPLKDDLKSFKQLSKDIEKTIKKIEKKKDSPELTELKEELIKQSESFKNNIEMLKNIIKYTYKDLKTDLTTQKEHTLLEEKVKNNFEDYFNLYQKSTIQGVELNDINQRVENAIEQLEDKSLMSYLKTKVSSKKSKHKIS